MLATSQSIFQLLDIIHVGFPAGQHVLVEHVSDNEEDPIIDEFPDDFEQPAEPHQEDEQAMGEQARVAVLAEENENIEVEGPSLVVFFRFEKEFPDMAKFKEFLAVEGCWSIVR